MTRKRFRLGAAALVFATGIATQAAQADTPPPVNFDEPAAVARSLLWAGSFDRMGKIFAKARAGKPVTIAAIGGSVTQGAWATTEDNRYLNRVAAWWREHYPATRVRLVNAGIGSTASNYGALRAERDVLGKSPDLVIVEFSVNDEWNEASVENYEGLVRKLLHAPSNPAVLLLFLCNPQGNGAQNQHIRVGAYYNLPMLSLSSALAPLIAEGPQAAAPFFQDVIHPNDRGHALIARIVTNWLDRVYTTAFGQGDLPLTSDILERTTLAEGGALRPAANTGWTFNTDHRAWEAAKPGAALTVDVDGTALFLSYFTEHGPWGRLSVSIDGGKPAVVDAKLNREWGGHLLVGEVARGLPAGPHRVVLTLLEPRDGADGPEQFRLYGVATSRPSK